MPHPKGDDTQPNPITHQTAWLCYMNARIYVKSIHEIKSQASSQRQIKLNREVILWLVKVRQVYISKDSVYSEEIHM